MFFRRYIPRCLVIISHKSINHILRSNKGYCIYCKCTPHISILVCSVNRKIGKS